MASPPGARITGRFVLLMAGFAISTAGTGLILPFTAIYLTAQLHLGNTVTAAYFVCTGATAVAVSLLGGQLADKIGARSVGSLGTLAMAAGYLMLGWSSSAAAVLASAAVVGAGNGLFQPAFTPIIASTVSEGYRRRAFAIRHLIMNAGLGIGAVLGSWLVGRAGVLHLLFLGNGLSYVPLAAVLWLAGAAASASRARRPPQKATYRRLLASRPVALLTLTQFFVAALAFAQLTTSVPLLVEERMGFTSRVVGAVFVANTLAVIVLQYPLAKLFDRISESATLVCAILLWILAFTSGTAAALTGGGVRTALLFTFPVVFALGEAAHACSFYSLLARVSPKESFGRANALVSLAYTLGNLSGPALGIALIGGLHPAGAWLALTIPFLLPLAAAALLDRGIRPAEPSAERAGPGHAEPLSTGGN
jgi:MFS family permease